MDNPEPVDQECVEGYIFVRRPERHLILRRPPERKRVWVPVSGKVDSTDADFLSATRREVREETGFGQPLRILDLDWEFRFRGPDVRRWRLHAFGVELESMLEPKLSREHESFAWLSYSTARERLHYADNREAIRRLHRIVVPKKTR